MLSPVEQWALHSYYEFTKSMTDKELLAHRAVVSKAQPSLPHRAGKAIAKLETFTKRLEAYRTGPHTSTQKKGVPYKIRVLSQLNPDIDPKLMAKILIEMARECGREDRAS